MQRLIVRQCLCSHAASCSTAITGIRELASLGSSTENGPESPKRKYGQWFETIGIPTWYSSNRLQNILLKKLLKNSFQQYFTLGLLF